MPHGTLDASPLAAPTTLGTGIRGAGVVPDVHRIAVLRSNGIGDLVVALPALDALRAAYPQARITYLGSPWHPALLEGRPGPWDDVAVVPAFPGLRPSPDGGSPGVDEALDGADVRAFLDEHRSRHYDLAVQLHGGGAQSNPFVNALGARVSVGLRDSGAAPLDRWVPYVYYQHEVLRFLETVALVGAAPVRLEPHLAVTDADRAAADAALREAMARAGGLTPGSTREHPLLVVHPGATDPRRRWPAERFADVAAQLTDPLPRLVVIGHGADDAEAARVILERFAQHTRRSGAAGAGDRSGPEPLDLVGRLSLGATVGVLEQARLMLGNDSGPRHLAAAVGTATVGVFWCGNLVNAGPLTRTRHRVGVSFRTACPVCGADQGRGRCSHDPSFVADVPLDEVLDAARDLWD